MRGPRLFAAFAISFIARGLYSHTNHKICYSAVSSGGIVLTLPGFAVSECTMLRSIFLGLIFSNYQPVSAALELSNKTMLTGSLKLVWAIFQALFIGFVQTLGSDLWLRLDSRARAQRLAMMEDITHTIYSQGLLTANWTTGNITNPISLSFIHTLDPNTAYDQYNYIGVGCYRGKHWPWYLQGLKWIWTIPFVPTFAFLLALWNLQALKSKKDVKNIIIMVTFGCASFTGWFVRIKPNAFRTSHGLSSKQIRRNLCPRVSGKCTRSFFNQPPWQCIFKAMERVRICSHGTRCSAPGAYGSRSCWRFGTKLQFKR